MGDYNHKPYNDVVDCLLGSENTLKLVKLSLLSDVNPKHKSFRPLDDLSARNSKTNDSDMDSYLPAPSVTSLNTTNESTSDRHELQHKRRRKTKKHNGKDGDSLEQTEPRSNKWLRCRRNSVDLSSSESSSAGDSSGCEEIGGILKNYSPLRIPKRMSPKLKMPSLADKVSKCGDISNKEKQNLPSKVIKTSLDLALQGTKSNAFVNAMRPKKSKKADAESFLFKAPNWIGLECLFCLDRSPVRSIPFLFATSNGFIGHILEEIAVVRMGKTAMEIEATAPSTASLNCK
ncbi:unnamed protein product [Dibothriocephalus latus]|uniref:Uncharacterized protein n=1 Tax=Dibothriocephalus latus TaxID=60516 RepID=A0A3P7MCL6_DIBLA|nr:unnamed protein product [Dibothriocephalus latus]